MSAISIRGFKSHSGRMLLTVLAIAVSIGFVSGTFILTDSLNGLIEGAVVDSYATVDAEVNYDDDLSNASTVVGPDLIANIRALPEVSSTESYFRLPPEVIVVVDSAGERVLPDKGSISAASWIGPNGYGDYELLAGSPPAVGEVAISRAYADRIGASVGDQVTLRNARTLVDQAFAVSAIVEPNFNDKSYELLFHPAAAQQIVDASTPSSLLIYASEGTDQVAVRDAIAPLLGPDLTVETGESVVASEVESARADLQIFTYVLLGFAVVALFVSIFIISNTFAILIAERVSEIGVLRAIGASRRQVRRLILVEAFALGLVASLLGVIFGTFIARGLASLIGDGEIPGFSTVVSGRTVFVAVLVGVLLSMFSAWLPARRAGKVSPIAAIRKDISTEASPRRRIIIGSIAFAASVLLLGSMFFAEDDIDATSAGIRLGGGTLLFFVAMSMLTVLTVPALITLFRTPVAGVKGSVGEIAIQNAARNPVRTAATATTLMIGISLVAFASVFGSSLAKGLTGQADAAMVGDIFLLADGRVPVSAEMSRAAVATTGVESGSFLYIEEALLVGADEETTLILSALNPATGSEIFDPNVIEGAGPGELTLGNTLVAQSFAEENNLAIGDTVGFEFLDGVADTLAVVGIYEGTEQILNSALISVEQHQTHTALPDSSVIYGMNIADGADETTVRSELVALAEPQGVSVVDVGGVKKYFNGVVGQLLAIINGLLGISIVVAFIGIVNAVMLSVLQRTREIGLLRAVGMTRRQLRSAVRWETSIITLIGTAAGLAIGVGLGWYLIRVIGDDSLPFSLSISSLTTMVILGAVLGLLAALLPARRASRLNVLDAISV